MEDEVARPLRIQLAGGFYHVTARGNERKKIFRSDLDRERFLSYLPELGARYHLSIHGYVLMENHYHLLLETAGENLSRAMQWLNTSYSQWFNRKYRRAGHLLQGRFQGVLVDWERWGLDLSRYLHLNPVRVQAGGLEKKKRKRISQGVGIPSTAGQVAARLEVLNHYRWSSYPAYIGKTLPPEWLTIWPVLRLVGGSGSGGRQRYQKYVEQGAIEDVGLELWKNLKGQMVLGDEEFLVSLQDHLRGNEEEQSSLRQLATRRTWEEAVQVVEQLKGERWIDFRDRRGDWGRDVALWLGRRHCGLTLRQLGERAGGLNYHSISSALRLLNAAAIRDIHLRAILKKADQLFIQNK
jgi:putative transposase